VYWLFAAFHRWQDRVLWAGFMASLGALAFLVQCLRRRRDRLTVVVLVVTALILAVMTAINSYTTRDNLVTGAIMLVAGVVSAAVVGVRELRRARLGGHVSHGGGSAEVAPPS